MYRLILIKFFINISVKYIINLTVNSLMLYVDVEQSDSNDRWTGEFTSQCNIISIIL